MCDHRWGEIREKEGNKHEQSMAPAFNKTFKKIREMELHE